MKTSALLLLSVALSSPSVAASAELIWEASGMVAPESVVLDPERRVFYVSNLGTHGRDAAPGDGFISRVSAVGQVLELRWVTGLDNPKGLALANGRLYVGDDADLVEIDPAVGKVVARYAPDDGPGAFNDVTADAHGNVYVCSGRLGVVFRLQRETLTPWFRVDRAKTGGINGLKADRDRLLLGGWSVKGADGNEQLGHLSTVAFADRAFGRLGNEPVCHIDGIEPDGRGGYIVSDWMTGDVLNVSAEGRPTPVLKLPRGAADHTYLIEEQLLVIPLMNDNVLRAYRWAPEERR